MFLRIITILVAILFLSPQETIAQKNNSKWNVHTYFDHLPDTCFYLCDWRDTSEYSMANSGIKTTDLKNGFISFKRHNDEKDFFQIALFKGSGNKDFVTVSTRECESCCCFTPTSFFYLYEDNTWKDVSSTFLPSINPSLFYIDAEQAELLNKLGYYRYNFILPQKGTTIKVELDICDYIVEENEDEITFEQYEKLVSDKKVISLDWNKKLNQFQLK